MIANGFDRPAEERSHENAERVAWIERGMIVLLVLGLIVGVLEILKPFTTAILFGAALATAAWPLRRALVGFGLRRSLAAVLLLVLSLALIALPLIVVAPNLAEQLNQGMLHLEAYFAASPEHPAWLDPLPLVGHRLGAVWDRLVESRGNVRVLAGTYAEGLEQMMIDAARAMADSVLQLILSLAVATMFWASGDALVAVLRDALRRLGGATAEGELEVAAGAIRGVAYGVVGTAAIQAALLAIGLALAGIPGAAMLGFVALLLAISQIGAPLLILIWGGAAVWLFGQGHQAWGVFTIIWGLMVSIVDNVIRPWLIGFGVEMPLSLTIVGVFGGFLAFGFLGLFIGPTLIAILFTLLQAWRASNLTPRQP